MYDKLLKPRKSFRITLYIYIYIYIYISVTLSSKRFNIKKFYIVITCNLCVLYESWKTANFPLFNIKVFNVSFWLLKTIYVHLLVCCLNKLQNARCNDEESKRLDFITKVESFYCAVQTDSLYNANEFRLWMVKSKCWNYWHCTLLLLLIRVCWPVPVWQLSFVKANLFIICLTVQLGIQIRVFGYIALTCCTERSPAVLPRHRFFLVSLWLKANAEMVAKIPNCHYMLLM